MTTDTTWQIAEDRKTAELTMGGVKFTLSTEQLDTLIAGLGHMRTMMAPEVAADWDPQTTCRASRNPAWRLQISELIPGVLLHVRDARFGWLHFGMPAAEAEKLGSRLVQAAEICATHLSPAQGNAN